MKILYLSDHALPLADGASLPAAKLMRALMARGHEVRLITRKHLPPCATESHIVVQPGWEEIGCPTHHVEVAEPTSRDQGKLWNRIHSLLDPAVVPGYLDCTWVRAAAPVLREEIRKYKPDLVFTTQFVENYIAALLIRREQRFVWIAALIDPWEKMSLFEKPSSFSHFHHYHRRMLSCLARSVDGFIFPCKRLELFEKRFSHGPWPKHVSIIPHIGIAADRATPRNQNKFRFVFLGDLTNAKRSQGKLPEGIAEAIKRNPALRGDLEMVFAGDIPTEFKARTESVVGPAVEWIPWCPYVDALELTSSSDVNVMIEADAPEGVLMLAKLADYAMVPQPILALAPRVGYVADLAAQGQCLHAPPDDVAIIAEKVLELYDAWKTGNLSRYKHDELAKICKPESAAAQFEDLYQSIIQQGTKE